MLDQLLLLSAIAGNDTLKILAGFARIALITNEIQSNSTRESDSIVTKHALKKKARRDSRRAFCVLKSVMIYFIIDFLNMLSNLLFVS